MASFPAEVAAPLQYGPRLEAIAVYLVPWGRACEILADLLGTPLSEGTLASLIERCAATLQPVEEQIKQALMTVEVLHQDETGLYVSGQRHWLHVACTEQARAAGLACLHPLEVAHWQAQFVAIVAQADATTPYAQAPPGHKGRVKQSAARNLLDRLLAEQEAVLLRFCDTLIAMPQK